MHSDLLRWTESELAPQFLTFLLCPDLNLELVTLVPLLKTIYDLSENRGKRLAAAELLLEHLQASCPGRQARWGDSLLAVGGLTRHVPRHVCRRLRPLWGRQQRSREVSGGGVAGWIPAAGVQQLHLRGGSPAGLREQNQLVLIPRAINKTPRSGKSLSSRWQRKGGGDCSFIATFTAMKWVFRAADARCSRYLASRPGFST